MKSDVSVAEIEAYQRDGYVVLRNVLEASEVIEWKNRLDQAIERRRRNPPDGPLKALDENPKMNPTFVQQVDLWKTDDTVRDFFLAPAFGRIASLLTGMKSVRLWFSTVLVKRPYADVTPYHVDGRRWPFVADRACTIWTAFDHVDASNGCLCYIAGSQNIGSNRIQALADSDTSPTVGAVFDHFPDWRDVPPIFCSVDPGDAVVHSALIIHGATANMTPQPRYAMTCSYMPSDPTLNGYESALLSDRSGSAGLADDEAYPVVFHSN